MFWNVSPVWYLALSKTGGYGPDFMALFEGELRFFLRQTNSATKIKGDVSKGSWDMKQQNVQTYLSIKYLKLETKKGT